MKLEDSRTKDPFRLLKLLSLWYFVTINSLADSYLPPLEVGDIYYMDMGNPVEC